MADSDTAKVPSNIRLTRRQQTVVTRESGRLGISFSDTVRRIIDEWIDRTQKQGGLATKLYETGRAG